MHVKIILIASQCWNILDFNLILLPFNLEYVQLIDGEPEKYAIFSAAKLC